MVIEYTLKTLVFRRTMQRNNNILFYSPTDSIKLAHSCKFALRTIRVYIFNAYRFYL